MIVYVESSAAVKLLFREAETDALRALLDALADDGNSLVSSVLLDTELRRTAVRGGASQALATAVLDRLDLVDLDRATYTTAGLFPDPALRSLDALHLAVALRVSADLVVTYDDRQRAAAIAAGLHVIAPS